MAKRLEAAKKRRRDEDVDLTAYTMPPQNSEAEQSLLTAVLVDPKTITNVADVVDPDDFYVPAHRMIFAAMRKLFDRNEPTDLVAVTNELKNQKQLEDVGGMDYMLRLMDSVAMAVNPPYYAKIIKEKATLRRLIDASRKIIRECHESREDVREVVDYAENEIFAVAENRGSEAFTPLEGLITESFRALEQRARNKALVTGVPTGFKRLDTLTSGLQPADLVILAARPSMGKTALALNMARNAAEQGVPVAVFSLEMSKQQLAMRMLCSEARVDSQRVRGGFLGKDDNTRLSDAGNRLFSLPIYIDDAPDLSALDVRAKVRRLSREFGAGLVIIDYLQLMKGRADVERRDLEISEISRSLKGLAKEANVPVVALSQLNRNLEQRQDKHPQLADLRESGALEQDADVIIFIYRDEVYNKDENNPKKGTAEVTIAKQRNGPTGIVTLAFLGEYTRFEDLHMDQ
ncbi:MAG: replicative DNA helicase [Desulfatibacillaceae bacterium]